MSKRLDIELLPGTIDLHVHSSPSMFHRHDTVEIAKNARELGIRAMILKSHHHPTIDRATYVARMVPGVDILHSITLNFAVGGINPFAVDIAIKYGAKCVWMPTIDTAQQKVYYGGLGGYGAKMSFDIPKLYQNVAGIVIYNDDNKIKKEVMEVIELTRDANVILAVGHLTLPEIKALVKAAKEVGHRKILVDHPHFPFCQQSLEFQQELVSLGAILNYTASEISPMWYTITAEEIACQINAIGPQNIVLSSDLGQIPNMLPAEGLRIFYALLLQKGITEAEIKLMAHKNPARLVYNE
jgi:hypothetical protein